VRALGLFSDAALDGVRSAVRLANARWRGGVHSEAAFAGGNGRRWARGAGMMSDCAAWTAQRGERGLCSPGKTSRSVSAYDALTRRLAPAGVAVCGRYARGLI
jgi:hypothetical protein